MQLLLIGNPNVGKSAVFNRLTGADVIISNYPGATVEYTQGTMLVGHERVEVIDVPGIYTLEPTCRAEEIALEMLGQYPDAVVLNIIDATHLERSLCLTLQLVQKKARMLVALNLWDEAAHVGIEVNAGELERILGVPCVPTCALSGEGIKRLVEKIAAARVPAFEVHPPQRWQEIGRIVARVQTVRHRHHTFAERLADATVRPLPGILMAALILFLTFKIILFIGEGLIGVVFEPLFNTLWQPILMKFSALLGGQGVLHNILLGKLIDGTIDYGQSFGLLSTGLFVPVGAVLPYVFAFYLVLSLLEDTGYLPRLAVVVDVVMHRVGLHGLAIIPMLLGLGCNVPGVLSTRILETRREKFIAATLLAIAAPCMALQAMVIGLVGRHGLRGPAVVFGTLAVVWIVLGYILGRFVPGESPEIFVEIPPYRWPSFSGLIKKVWMRMKWFVKEAVPFVLLGVLIVNLLYNAGIIQFAGRICAPVITGIMGLPADTAGALIIGFLRKDVAVGMLAPLNLSLKQLVIASVTLSITFPCIATFAMLLRELGIKDMMKSSVIMIGSSIIVGGVLNIVIPPNF
jgi:ferrous iron transport protein B